MSDLLWKAVRRDYTTGGGTNLGGTVRPVVRWGVGTTVTHPTSGVIVSRRPSTFLSASPEPAETLVGSARWPDVRLVRVDTDWHRDAGIVAHARAFLTGRVVDEVEPWRALGPHGRTVAAVLDRCSWLTADDLQAMRDRRERPMWYPAINVAQHAARSTARSHAYKEPDEAIGDTKFVPATVMLATTIGAIGTIQSCVQAVVVRDALPDQHRRTLLDPLESVVGPVDDLPVPAWVDEIGAPR